MLTSRPAGKQRSGFQLRRDDQAESAGFARYHSEKWTRNLQPGRGRKTVWRLSPCYGRQPRRLVPVEHFISVVPVATKPRPDDCQEDRAFKCTAVTRGVRVLKRKINRVSADSRPIFGPLSALRSFVVRYHRRSASGDHHVVPASQFGRADLSHARILGPFEPNDSSQLVDLGDDSLPCCH